MQEKKKKKSCNEEKRKKKKKKTKKKKKINHLFVLDFRENKETYNVYLQTQCENKYSKYYCAAAIHMKNESICGFLLWLFWFITSKTFK